MTGMRPRRRRGLNILFFGACRGGFSPACPPGRQIAGQIGWLNPHHLLRYRVNTCKAEGAELIRNAEAQDLSNSTGCKKWQRHVMTASQIGQEIACFACHIVI